MQKDDVIYRQVAIDAIDECFKKVVRAGNMSAYEYDSAYAQGEIDAYVAAIDTLKTLAPVQPEPSEITDEQAILHLQSTGWMQNHDREIYESGLKERLADDSESYDSLIPYEDDGDTISRQAAIDALWKALYEYEDKTEKQFQESEDLDVGDWIEHRIFVQDMNDIDRQTILNLPSAQPATNCSEIPNGSDDTISRQTALDAFGLSEKTRKYGGDHSGYDTRMLYEIQDTLENLPAVQPERVCVATVTLTDEQVKEAVEKAKNAVISVIEPEPHWIPCSERLPKKTGYYLTTNEYKVVHEDYYWGSGCFEKAKKYQCEVEAWMPMPIPLYYGGNGE